MLWKKFKIEQSKRRVRILRWGRGVVVVKVTFLSGAVKAGLTEKETSRQALREVRKVF